LLYLGEGRIMSKDIIPKNEKGEYDGYCTKYHENDILPKNIERKLHGYCEVYWSNGQLCWKGVRINGRRYGYFKHYCENGSVNEDWTGYFFNSDKISEDNKDGYCYIWRKKEL